MNTLTEAIRLKDASSTESSREFPRVETSEVLRRFYHVRESGRTEAYDLICGIKQHVLQQKGTAQLIAASNNADLERLLGVSPDTGSLNVLEQEHHDMKLGSKPWSRKRYQRDHFILVEGTGEELAMTERFLFGKGYQFIDVKTCMRKEKLEKYLESIPLFRSEVVSGMCPQENTKIQSAKHKMGNHFQYFSDTYSIIAIIGGAIMSIGLLFYAGNLFMRSSEDPKSRGVIQIMKDDFFGNKTQEVRKSSVPEIDKREITGATYSFSTKDVLLLTATAHQRNLTAYLNSRYTNIVSYTFNTPYYKSYEDSRDHGTVEGIITGNEHDIQEIRVFVKGSLPLSKDSFTYVYKKSEVTKEAQRHDE